MNKFNILIVDDEWNMRNLLRIHLNKQGFNVIEAKNGHEAIEKVKKEHIDVIILDLMMPVLDGIEVCKRIRGTHQMPILMLTARTETKDKVEGLSIGADDYLTKPFEPEELIARVYALIRRVSITETEDQTDEEVLTFDEMIIDAQGRQVIIQDKPVEFTPKEFNLLYLLARNTERVFTREHLLSQIWGNDYFGDERTVDTHIKSIRLKLRQEGLSYNPIHTVWGVGYKFKKQEG